MTELSSFDRRCDLVSENHLLIPVLEPDLCTWHMLESEGVNILFLKAL